MLSGTTSSAGDTVTMIALGLHFLLFVSLDNRLVGDPGWVNVGVQAVDEGDASERESRFAAVVTSSQIQPLLENILQGFAVDGRGSGIVCSVVVLQRCQYEISDVLV